MSGERFRIAADIVVSEWKSTLDVNRKSSEIYLTNEDILVGMIAEELKKEHDDTKKTYDK